MNIGKMDRLITLERFTDSRNALNERIKTWSAICSVWAQFIPSTGSEVQEAEQRVGKESGKWIIHYIFGLTQKDRINYEGYWDITSIKPYEGRSKLEIEAMKKDTQT